MSHSSPDPRIGLDLADLDVTAVEAQPFERELTLEGLTHERAMADMEVAASCSPVCSCCVVCCCCCGG